MRSQPERTAAVPQVLGSPFAALARFVYCRSRLAGMLTP